MKVLGRNGWMFDDVLGAGVQWCHYLYVNVLPFYPT